MSLSNRIRPDVEAAPWVIEEVKKLEAKIASLEKDEKMFLNEHDENVRLHFENVDLKEQNSRYREALEEISKPPYKDSDLKSLMEWVNAKARAALEKK